MGHPTTQPENAELLAVWIDADGDVAAFRARFNLSALASASAATPKEYLQRTVLPMEPHEVMPWIRDPAPCFVCERLDFSRKPKPDPARYRVPIIHQQLERSIYDGLPTAEGVAAASSLPDLESVRQLRALVGDGIGLGLFTPKSVTTMDLNAVDPLTLQSALGSVLVFPPGEWAAAREDVSEWFADDVEGAFEGLPYTFDDVLPFAGPNFSPDRWLLVLRGPMAGAVVWWTHDGDSQLSEPWADDLKHWARRLVADVPMSIGFSGSDSIDPVDADAKLSALYYHSDASFALS